ncbi:MAG: TonB family protein [Gammaproteobacteria bacterium]|nr:TonB family protein [Gammaproteobacteria bacterium]
MSAVISYESQALKWRPDNGSGLRFTIINIAVLIISLSAGLFLSSIELPKEERKARVVVPERVAQLILRKEKPKPIPKLVPKPKLEQKIEPVPKPEPKREVQPKPKKTKIKTPLTDNQKKTLEKAKKSGLLALSDELADLMDTSAVSAMVSGKINQVSGSEIKAKIDTNVLAIEGKVSTTVAKIKEENLSSTISSTRLSDQARAEVAQTLMAKNSAASDIAGEQKSPGKKSKSTSGSGNSRTDEDIAYVMDQNKGKLYSVYRQARRVNPGLKGRIVFDVTILPSGKVSEVVIRSSELNDPKLERRLLARVKSFDFGAREEGGSITITYPVEFLPS